MGHRRTLKLVKIGSGLEVRLKQRNHSGRDRYTVIVQLHGQPLRLPLVTDRHIVAVELFEAEVRHCASALALKALEIRDGT